MAVKFFSQYLIDNKLITQQQLQECYKIQNKYIYKLGVLAIDNNFMSPKQVRDVLIAQEGKNRAFGQIAVAKGYITKEQLDELLFIQKRDRILLGEALIEKKFLSLLQLQKALKAFNEENSVAKKQVFSSEQNIPVKYQEIVKSIQSIVENAFIIMINETVKINGYDNFIDKNNKYEYVVYVPTLLSGQKYIIALALNSEMLCYIASVLERNKYETPNEEVFDSVKEFVNIINGHILTQLNDKSGGDLDIKPPSISSFSEFVEGMPEATELSISMRSPVSDFDVYALLY